MNKNNFNVSIPPRFISILVSSIVTLGLVSLLLWGERIEAIRLFDEQVFLFIQHQNKENQPTPTIALFTPTPTLNATATNDELSRFDILSPELRRKDSTTAAEIMRVIDGDTVELTDGQVVRYNGIDTPETKHPNKSVQCYGIEAAKFNEQLVLGKTVVLERDVSNTDRYGRLLRYVWLDGKMVNWQLVAEGYAFAKTYPPDIAYQTFFNQAQQFARDEKTGLWAVCPQ